MADDADIENKLITLLAQYEVEIERGSEADVDYLLDAALELVPNSRLTDLYFYPEKPMSLEETAAEAVRREAIWKSEGEIALLIHIKQQAELALADRATDELGRANASSTLNEVEVELARLTSGNLAAH